jgi:acetoin utilization deacetylase AcuC-like enzyme
LSLQGKVTLLDIDYHHGNGALERIHKFQPQFLVLALGLDTAKGDPTGSFSLMARDFHAYGKMIGALNLPTLVVQEGGYKTQTLGINARHFFTGLWEGVHGKNIPHPARKNKR